MSAAATTWTEAELDGFDLLLEQYRGPLAQWESAGGTPRDVFAALGALGAYRRRWELGRIEGLPLAAELTARLSVASGSLALGVSLHSEVFVNCLMLGGWGSDDQLSGFLDGSLVGCFAATEPTGGSDLIGVTSHSERVSADRYRLRGTKWFTTNLAPSTHALVLVRNEREGSTHNLFLLPLDHPGVSVGTSIPTLGVRGTDTATWSFDLELGSEALVGQPGQGYLLAHHVLNHERLMAAVGLVSAADWALRFTTEYLRNRTQFGSRLMDHQVLRQRLARDWCDVQAAKALVARAMSETRSGQLKPELVSAAKVHCASIGSRVLDSCLQALGGRGFSAFYPIERMLRDARVTRIGGGTDEVLLELVAQRLDRPAPRLRDEIDRCEARFLEPGVEGGDR